MQVENPSLLRILKGHKQAITCLDVHATCKYVVTAGSDQNFLLWNLKEENQAKRFEGHKTQIQDLKFHPNGTLLGSAATDGSIKLWDLMSQGKQVTLTKAHNAKIRSINFSCDGNLLVSAADDKNIKIWSTIDRRLQGIYKKHDNWVRYCQFSPIAKSLISCDDRMVLVWDVETRKVVNEYKEHAGVIHQAKFHSLGNIAASCSHDKKIKIYDIRARSVIQVYQGHQGPVKSIDFHPHSAHLISSSEDGTTRIWNTQKSQLQYTIASPSNVAKFSKEGEYFFTAGVEKVVNLWKTGFYDTFKQKVIGIDSVTQTFQDKVKRQEFKTQKHDTQKSEDFLLNKQNISGNEQRHGQADELMYCHVKQNFQIAVNQAPAANTQKPRSIPQTAIPLSLSRKLQRLKNQLDFITKTTQILEERVINNGEQLKRMVDVVRMGDIGEPQQLEDGILV